MADTHNNAAFGIAMICVAVIAISVNDMLIKLLSDSYPLHQVIFARATIGLLFSLVFLHLEGGWSLLKTTTPGLHALRGVLIVFANMTFYAAVAVLPLAQATALFFVAPLMITLLSIPILGEKVGVFRMSAVLVGFVGVVIMQEPWATELTVARGVLLLPVLAALLYALVQVMTRRLGVVSKASALAIYIQFTFMITSVGFFLVAGDGRFVSDDTPDSLVFLLRAWTWPLQEDLWVFAALGVGSGVIGYTISAAYRVAAAATVAPFEYVGLPMAIFWGWAIFGEWPSLPVWMGCFLIVAAGLFVYLRERMRRGNSGQG